MVHTENVQLGLRQIGRVQVFDLSGTLAGETLDSVIEKIEHTIHKKQLRRVILNLQKVQTLDELALRKLIACLLRPQRSLVFVPDGAARDLFLASHVPSNIKLCQNEEEVAEAFGSFLFLKDKMYQVPVDESQPGTKDYGLERRRSKRIRVAIPIHIKFQMKDGSALNAKAIATNVSQGGIFAEFLSLDSPEYTKMQGLEGSRLELTVPPNDTFKEEMTIPGKIVRFELNKKQYGIAIQFL